MRLFWAGFLMTGVLLVGLDAYERRESASVTEDGGAFAVASEDGTPMPYPYPTPSPKTR